MHLLKLLYKKITIKGYRRDGKLANVSYFQKCLPFLIRKRSEAVIYMPKKFNMNKAVSLMDEYNSKSGKTIKITPFSLFLAAMVKTAYDYPYLNRFITGKRIYDRNKLEICYVVKTTMTLDGKEVVVKEAFNKDDNIFSIAKKISKTVTNIKSEKYANIDKSMKVLASLPRFLVSFIFFMIRSLDYFDLAPSAFLENNALYCSCFITNVGSLGQEAPYHHMFDMGTTSVFVAIGEMKKEQYINESKKISEKYVMDAKFSIDERIADGYYYSKALERISYYIENPQNLI